MPNPTQRDEREKLDKQKKKAESPKPPPPPKEDVSLGGTIKKINERQKLLDET